MYRKRELTKKELIIREWVREIHIFTGAITNIDGHKHPSYYRLFPYWREL